MDRRADAPSIADDADARRRAAPQRTRPRRRARSATACRPSCCPATGSTARRRTRCSRSIPTSTSSRRPRSATSTGSASGSTRTTGGHGHLRRRLHGPPFRRLLRQAGGGADAHRGRRRGQRLLDQRASGPAAPQRAAGRHIEVCRLLIASGADVNATQRHGFTPLHAAAQHGDIELVELLSVGRRGSPASASDAPMAATADRGRGGSPRGGGRDGRLSRRPERRRLRRVGSEPTESARSADRRAA